ncbi:hypothetical protein [Bosea sp. AS-1]|uniref:hypothetical protein n=1 Tax=Bosea sp. AS-1 TaxID=2015316 RepID=UPI000B7826AC|nr:hypothetical protein [Bosea sp. AS-1]
MIDEKALIQILRDTIKVDASGLAPAVVAHHIMGFEEAAQRILQALRPGSTGEAEGWVLVPKEPTEAMIESGMAAMRVTLSDGLPRDQRQAAGYRAMLAAAGGEDA